MIPRCVACLLFLALLALATGADENTWDFDGACPLTVQLDKQTLGTVFYDVDARQSGGPGVFFLQVPLTKLGKEKKEK